MSTKIEWTDETWNPLRGCSRVSEGCRNCYAERQAHRFSALGQAYAGLVKSTPDGPRWTGKVRLVPEQLEKPLRWRKPRRIFVNSMSDLFHESLSDETIGRVFEVMMAPETAHHTFQVLTKRADRMREFVTRYRADGGPLAPPYSRDGHDALGRNGNVWLGVSVENQRTANERISQLARTPAAVRFISAEPLLTRIDITNAGIKNGYSVATAYTKDGHGIEWTDPGPRYIGLDWVIVGGESGPGARPCRVEWIERIVRDCAAASVPCFVKQLGAWREPRGGERFNTLDGEAGSPTAFLVDPCGDIHCTLEAAGPGSVAMLRAGGKNADPNEWPEQLRVQQWPA